MKPAAPLFSDQDQALLEGRGLSENTLLRQLAQFERGPVYADLKKPCRIGDGILRLGQEELRRYHSVFAEAARRGRVMKFVPASGAGTRMFRKFLEGLHGSIDAALKGDLDSLPEYPYYLALKQVMAKAGFALDDDLKNKNYRRILEFLLEPQGLDYAESPKGLVLFHAYPDGARSAFEEQLAEAVELARDEKGIVRLHFTVAEGYREKIRQHLSQATARFASLGVFWEIEYSTQASSTDTIAADEANRPFRDLRGELVFRPAGHGALLENLQATKGDLVFIKNIDNVSPERLRHGRLEWERALGGVLVEMQNEVFLRLRRLEVGEDFAGMEELADFLKSNFGLARPTQWNEWKEKARADWLRSAYHRPLRIAGMVPNQGEPGGAPFWVRDAQGRVSAQIVESAQVDPDSSQQLDIFRSSTHFNPVNLVCGLRDYHGNAFDLKAFVDSEAGFISKKSHEGKALQALERPGLWNGSMAYWNTVFVEVPAETFSPVKSAEDLLRPEHRA